MAIIGGIIPAPFGDVDGVALGAIDLQDALRGGRYMLTTDTHLGDPVNVTTTMPRGLADGSIVVGQFVDNRQGSLFVYIEAPDRLSLAQAVEALATEVSKDFNTLTWYPAGNGKPGIVDVFKGQMTLVQRMGLARLYQVDFQGLPYLRSLNPVTIAGTNPQAVLHAWAQSSNDLAFSSSDNTGNMVARGALSPITATVYSVPGASSSFLRFAFAKQTITTVDLSMMDRVLLRQSPVLFPFAGGITAAGYSAAAGLTLYSSGGSTTYSMAFDSAANVSVTSLQSGAVSSTGAGVDLAHVTGWALDLASATNASGSQSIYPSSLTAYPAASTLTGTTFGGVHVLAGVAGGVPTRCALEIDLAGSTLNDFLLYRAPDGIAGPSTPMLVSMGGMNATLTLAAPANLSGTYEVILAGGTGTEGTLTVKQLVNGTVVATSAAMTGNRIKDSAGTDYGYATYGQISLPIKATTAENVGVSYQFIFAGQTGTTRNDMILADTRGNLIIAHTAGAKYAWIDEPAIDAGLGMVWAGVAADRSDAAYVACHISGGAISLDPGDNYLLTESTSGVPNITATYYPKWAHEVAG